MDAGLFILIKEITIESGLLPVQDKYVFGGKEYYRDDLWYKFKAEKIFQKSKLSEWIYQYLPKQFQGNEFICLLMSNDVLSKLELIKNGKNTDVGNDKYRNIIKELLTRNKEWVMVFLEQWDQINETICCDSLKAINKLYENIDWNYQRKGFVCYSKI